MQRQISLDLGDGLDEEEVESQEPLRDALRRSASGRYPDQPQPKQRSAQRSYGDDERKGEETSRQYSRLVLRSARGPASSRNGAVSSSPARSEATSWSSSLARYTTPDRARRRGTDVPMDVDQDDADAEITRFPARQRSARDATDNVDVRRANSLKSTSDILARLEARRAAQGRDSTASGLVRRSTLSSSPQSNQTEDQSTPLRRLRSCRPESDQAIGIEEQHTPERPMQSEGVMTRKKSRPNLSAKAVEPRTPLSVARRVSNSAEEMVQRSEQSESEVRAAPADTARSSQRLLRKKASSDALASLEASLARLTVSSPSSRESQDKAENGRRSSRSRSGSAEVEEHRAQPDPASPFLSKRRHTGSHHLARLLSHEGKADEAGNSPRKELPDAALPVQKTVKHGVSSGGTASGSSSSASGTSGSGSSTFLERARAARAQQAQQMAAKKAREEAEQQRGAKLDDTAQRRQTNEAACKRQTRRVSSQRRSSPPVPSTPRGGSSTTEEDAEDELDVEKQLTPENSPRRSALADGSDARSPAPRTSEMGLRKRRSLYDLNQRKRALQSDSPVPACPSLAATPGTRKTRSAQSTPMPSKPSSSVTLSGRERIRPIVPPFQGIAVLVDVRSATGHDLSSSWNALLKLHGAKVASRCPSADSRRQLTHIVWKGGKPSTWRYWQSLAPSQRPAIVSVGWVQECVERGRKLGEASYLAEVGRAAWLEQERLRKDTGQGRDAAARVAAEAPPLKRATSTDEIQALLDDAHPHAAFSPSPLRHAIVPEQAGNEREDGLM
ncbi:unnamed protein product [Jaminaea pallidilutea]